MERMMAMLQQAQEQNNILMRRLTKSEGKSENPVDLVAAAAEAPEAGAETPEAGAEAPECEQKQKVKKKRRRSPRRHKIKAEPSETKNTPRRGKKRRFEDMTVLPPHS